ncbi:MAG TPA: FliH/SctL family protein, partial [bacterium]|nr:FliH/SctL family protein [bacterium]
TIYIKEVKENTFAIDEKKELEEQLATLRKQIEDKKNELIELENRAMLELEQKKINILKMAEEEKNAIIQNAQTEIAIEKERAVNEGYEQGYKKAADDFRNETAQLLSALNNIILKIEQERKTKLLDIREEIFEIIKKIVNYVLAKEIETYSEDILINSLTEVLQEVSTATELIIKVNPKNVEKIESLKNQILSEISGLEKIKIIGAENLDIVSCIIETDKGNFDAKLQTKLENIFDNLKQTINELK